MPIIVGMVRAAVLTDFEQPVVVEDLEPPP
jgi:hypothetical protein